MAAAVPVVRVLGPGRNVGKTWLASRLIEELDGRGYRVGAVKSSHHLMPEDRPGSDTALFTAAGARPVVFAAGDGTLTRGIASRDLGALVAEMPTTIDVVVVEGFRADPLGARVEIVPQAAESHVRLWAMDGTFEYEGAMSDVAGLADALRCVLGISASGTEAIRGDVRKAARMHGHRCPGLTLGVRMAQYALAAIEAPPASQDLLVEVETARCATDAVAAVTGCTTGTRRLRIAEYGKLAATFSYQGRAVRVAARAGLRELASLNAACAHGNHAQDEAYRTLASDVLFDLIAVAPLAPAGHHHEGRGLCGSCGEEVARASLRLTMDGPRCIPCAGAADPVQLAAVEALLV
jgi:formylmethanofuran dehydrogenase subunit E